MGSYNEKIQPNQMKKLILISLLTFLCAESAFSQNSARQNYDSLWYFHPFSVELLAGVWMPSGNFSEFYSPSAQFGGSLGIMVAKNMRFNLWVMPRLNSQKEAIPFKVNDSVIHNIKNFHGASFGGWLSYTFCQGKRLSAEVITGVTKEDISSVVEKPYGNDTLNTSATGLSIGLNTWINTFSRLNFGLRAYYTYTAYKKSSYAARSTGGHAMTFAVVYRFPRRSQEFKRWY